MDKSTIIIILAVILFILIILNNVTITRTSDNDSDDQPTCADTKFGCCPDGVNSKIDYYGSNCPRYNPGPGYKVQPTPIKPAGITIPVTTVPGL